MFDEIDGQAKLAAAKELERVSKEVDAAAENGALLPKLACSAFFGHIKSAFIGANSAHPAIV